MNIDSLKQIWAIAVKEIRLDQRYILPFLANIFLGPLKTAVWFFIVYFGFFASGARGLGNFNQKNYILMLAIGSLFQIFFNLATNDFPNKFLNEKYWKTIQGILVAPLNSLKFVFGMILASLIKTSFAMVVFVGIALVFFPIAPSRFLVILLIIILTFVSLMFIGLIKGAYILINENVSTVFEYLFLGWGFISCFYYPIETFPKILRPIIFYNPVYQAIALVRNLWLDQPVHLFAFFWIIGWTILAGIVGILVFNYLVKHNDIAGY